MIFALRANNSARVTDIVKLRKFYTKQSTDMTEQLNMLDSTAREDGDRLEQKIMDATKDSQRLEEKLDRALSLLASRH